MDNAKVGLTENRIICQDTNHERMASTGAKGDYFVTRKLEAIFKFWLGRKRKKILRNRITAQTGV